jgi:cell division protease FtsH
VNEAALTAARVGRRTVGRDDFLAALERIVLGAERRITIPEHERRRTAYHEAGHALAGMVQEGADPVRKVSIIPRGRSLGVTYQSPSGDQYSVGEGYLLGRIIGALAGRAAELLVFGEATTGAEADLELATALARSMVGRWGMSPIVGPVSVLSVDDPSPIGLPMAGASEAMRNLVDEEVRRIVVESLERAKDLLAEHRGRLDALATALLDRETLDEADARRVAGLAPVAEIPAVRGLGSRT